MDYLLALLQGLGIAAAIGIRPFLPVLLVGALAGADLGVDFEGTEFAFLEQTGFLLAILVPASSLLGIVERRAAERVGVDPARRSRWCWARSWPPARSTTSAPPGGRA